MAALHHKNCSDLRKGQGLIAFSDYVLDYMNWTVRNFGEKNQYFGWTKGEGGGGAMPFGRATELAKQKQAMHMRLGAMSQAKRRRCHNHQFEYQNVTQ